MSNDAATLAHVIIEIEQIISEYLASPGKRVDATSAIEQVLLNIDTNDAIGIAQKILASFTSGRSEAPVRELRRVEQLPAGIVAEG